MIHQLASNPLFGLLLSISVYFLASRFHYRYTTALTNPLLISTVIIILFLKITGISYADYYKGGVYLNTLIIPSTVALGIPLYLTFHLMKHHARSIIIGSAIGSIVNISLTAIFAKIFGMKPLLAISIFPKSVTTAMAVGITEKMNGLATITLVVVVATGILTSVLGPGILKLLKIDDPVAVGVALGGTGHAIGTGKAMEYGKVEGAMAGLSIGVTGIMYVIFSPIIASLILN
ncbi:LrgB family protein [Enterococcus sp. MMGLQ5-2]|nr:MULTISPECIES: LrgB family protein [unclassified Enterococcus]NPD12560.1 LrgB family protein [Enterococcus sp. MMGLQ5-1]NPD37036.1 LrgB family protein [Enterococcus sp. MMGLQ5-2]